MRHRSHSSVCLTAALFAAACNFANTPAPLPVWAIHIPPPDSTAPSDIEEAKRILIAEMAKGSLPSRYTSAERIAALSIAEIREEHPLDAVVLLAIASYRYHQAALDGIERSVTAADEHMKGKPQSAWQSYKALVREEAETFNNLNYDTEIEYAIGLWEKREGVADQIAKGLDELAATSEVSRDRKRNDLFARIEEARAPGWDQLAHPDLAEAFLERLSADASAEGGSSVARFYLAVVPFKRFHMAAIDSTRRYFEAPVCRAIAARRAAYEEELRMALSSTRPTVRSNAAIILGLRQNPGDVATIEAGLAAEEDPAARLSFEYALLRLGRKEHLGAILDAPFSCDTAARCDHAVQLLQWTPVELTGSLETAKLSAAAHDPARSDFFRVFAAVILADIGAARGLDPVATQALLGLSLNPNEDLSSWATRAVFALKNLDRDQVVARLSRRDVATDALLVRLSAIAQPGDLPRLRGFATTIAKRPDVVQAAIVDAIARIEGAKAEDLLVDLFVRHRHLRIPIAVRLAKRPGMSEERKEALARAHGGVAAVLIRRLAGEPSGVAAVRSLLTGGDFMDMYEATAIARLMVDGDLQAELWRMSALVDARYYPSDAIVRNNALRGLVASALADGFEKAKYAAVGKDAPSSRRPNE